MILFYVSVLFITVLIFLSIHGWGGGLSSLSLVFLLQSSASTILLFSVFSEDFHSTIIYCFIILYIKQLICSPHYHHFRLFLPHSVLLPFDRNKTSCILQSVSRSFLMFYSPSFVMPFV